MRKTVLNTLHLPKLNIHTIYPVKFYSHIKIFVHDYSLPLFATGVLVILISAAVFLRLSRQSSLADLLVGVTNTGGNYGTLLSKDSTDELKKNKDVSLPENNSTVSNNSSVSFNTNTGSGSSSGGTVSPDPVFGASIASFKLDESTLECSVPSQKLKFCSKRYAFSAAIRSVNGPGTIRYSWRSNLESAIENGSITAGSGTVVTTQQKSITLECLDPSNFTLQIVLSSPSSSKSNVLSINHNCNEL